jgi:chondroitin synthase
MIKENIESALCLPDIITANEIVKIDKNKSPTKDWRIKLYEKTNNLKNDPLPFKSFCSGNVALKKEYALLAGLFDENFIRWGNEDGEFGFRLYQLGLYFIPVLSAVGLHQEHSIDVNRKSRTEDNYETTKLRNEKVPLVRKYERDVVYEVPTFSIIVSGFYSLNLIEQQLEGILKQKYTDYEILIHVNESSIKTLEDIIKKYTNDRRIKWIITKYVEISINQYMIRNMCKGIYIAELPDGCILKSNFLETIIRYYKKNIDVGCVFTLCEKLVREKRKKIIKDDRLDLSLFMEYAEKALIIYRKRDYGRLGLVLDNQHIRSQSHLLQSLGTVCNIHYIVKSLYVRK